VEAPVWMRRLAVVAAMAMVAAVGCSSSDTAGGTGGIGPVDPAGAEETTQTTADSVEESLAPLTILVSNDDGVDHPGLDLMVRSLAQLENVEVVVVAPAENQSGTSDQTTPGGAAFAEATTASGVEAVAVDGFPADSVRVALDDLGIEPDLVVSGINDAQNIGPFAGASGTVGVARTAVRDGIPAIAVSAGLVFDEAQFAVGADLVVAWVEENRQALADQTMPAEVISFNIPTCDPSEMGEVVEVSLATEFIPDTNPFESQCDLAGPPPSSDVEAINSGYPSRTVVPEDIESVPLR